MIFTHEGLPRSGKSYEAVLFHILPALKAGTQTYVRLNGVWEQRAEIAKRLEMTVEQVEALLHPMGDREVKEWLVCRTNNDGSMEFPHIPQNSLVVVDEAQEYWPTGRASMPAEVENFFSKHGHANLNIVLQTQDWKDLHRHVMRRVAKRNVYTKLDALGIDKRYSVRFFNRVSVDKFETMGTETRVYDETVFVCYHGVQPGVEENAVYKSNTRTLWKTAKWPAIAVAVSLLLGVGMLARFFMGGGAPEVAKEKPTEGHAPGEVYQRPVEPVQPTAVPNVAAVYQQPVEPVDTAPAAVRYVSDLAKSGRPRFAGFIGDLLIVEFRASGAGNLLDQLTSDQLAAMGWTLTRTAYGALATYEDREIVFTAWPVDMIGVQSIQTTERIRAAGAPVTTVESQPRPVVGSSSGATAAGSTQQHAYGQFRETSNPGNYTGSRIYGGAGGV